MYHRRRLLSNITSVIKQEERDLLISKFKGRFANYPFDTVIDLFKEQTAMHPHFVAVSFENDQLTYQDLDDFSNRLAYLLRHKGIAADCVIPLMLEPSIELIICILGIIKAGAAYLPIDSEYPTARIEYLINDAGAKVVISNKANSSKLKTIGSIEIVEIDNYKLIGQHEYVPLSLTPDQLAYVIYTSGSTGKPKGVMIEHKSLVNRLCWAKDYFNLTTDDVVLQKTTFCFDVSVWELLGPLTAGARIVMATSEGRKDPQYIRKIIQEERVTIMHFVPSMIAPFFGYLQKGDCSSLNKILCSGEELKLSQINLIKDKFPAIELHNLYGPTEATIDVTCWSCFKETTNITSIPIGKPVTNTAIYILNKSCDLVPNGSIGEIYIGGIQVARGYLNNKSLTDENFVSDPFSEIAGGKMYKTGDFGRWLPDGSIQYLGRGDEQVKIRGYRIELSEIERIIEELPSVNGAVVVSQPDSKGDQRLVGYIIPCAGFTEDELMSFLRSKLPGYMIPAIWVKQDSFQLTSNGKVDRKALVNNRIAEKSGDCISPRNEAESKLAAIWQELLGIQTIGVYDNFFHLGGHSLLAIQLITTIRKYFNVQISVKDLFAYPTIETLATFIQDQKQLVQSAEIDIAQTLDRVPLSFSQERIWFIHQLKGSVQYHIPVAFKIKGRLNKEALEHAFRKTVEKHEALRTVFYEYESRSYQFVLNTDNWRLQIINNGDLPDASQMEAYVQKLIEEPFDLTKDYMLRAYLFERDAEYNIAVLIFHHIASDGLSITIFAKTVAELYNAFMRQQSPQLDRLPFRYIDYALWQRKYLQGDVLQEKIKYWQEKLKDLTPFELPVDYPRTLSQSAGGAIIEFAISREYVDALRQISNTQNATLFITLLSAFKILLYRYSGQDDICVGTPFAGRPLKEWYNLVGLFVNTLVLRTPIDGRMTFNELLLRVRETVLEAYEYQDAPFEKIVEAVAKERDLTGNPLFQVLFALQNTNQLPELKLDDLEVLNEDVKFSTSKFDLSFGFLDNGTDLKGTVEYSSDLYKEETILQMISHFKTLVRSIVEEPKTKIANLTLLSHSEQHKLVYEFNNTSVSFPLHKTFIDLFEEQVERTPGKTALLFETHQLSYSQLNRKANQLANYLRGFNLKEESVIPLCIERSFEMIVAIIGILKAGAAFVPIDAEYPKEVILDIMRDTQATVLVSSSRHTWIPGELKDVIAIDIKDPLSKIQQQDDVNPPNVTLPGHLAYLIYTSGTTGRPKGIMIEHRNLSNYLHAFNTYFSLSRDDLVLQQLSISFDMMIEQIFPPLAVGASVRIILESNDGNEIIECIESGNATILSATPLMIDLLNKELTSTGNLRYLISGGDVLNGHYVDNLLGRVAIVNGYGPSETTVAVTFNVVDTIDQASAIGKPIANSQIYILDKMLRLVPVGVPGEIYIGGLQVARGYWNLEDLTNEKFCRDIFSEDDSAKLFRSGDLAKWGTDGSIHFICRTDEEIKVRGYRIEPGQIETILKKHNEVNDAIVLGRKDQAGNKRLVGYIVPTVPGSAEFWPSVGEYPVYDDVLYYAMSNDKKRNTAYRHAIGEAVADKSVVDIGTGKDALLARFCLDAGAKIVYAIEIDHDAYLQAESLVLQLGLQDKLVVIFGDALKVDLPELVDVCVSETFGTIGGSEGAGIILGNASRFLKENGKVIPGRCITKMAAVSLPENLYTSPEFSAQGLYYVDKIFQHTGMQFNLRLCIKNFDPENIISNETLVEELRFNAFWKQPRRTEFCLEISREARFDGLLLWINLYPGEHICINSLKDHTSWLPVYLPVFYPGLIVNKGDVIRGEFIIALNETNIHPDYIIQGKLIRNNGDCTDFECYSFYKENQRKENAFYKKLFGPKEHSSSIKSKGVLSERLHEYLRDRLPFYMVPEDFHIIESIPVTPAGKPDVKALPEPLFNSSYGYVEPETTLECVLVSIWQNVLDIEKVGVYDNFFQLGGHSLSATRLIARIRRQLHIEFSIKELFTYSCIRHLAKFLETQNRGIILPPLVKTIRPARVPLSFAQKRLWFIDKLQGSQQYHVPLVLGMKGDLNIKALQIALQHLINRHDVFRTVIKEDAGQPWLDVRDTCEDTFEIIDDASLKHDADRLEQYVSKLISMPFELEKDRPLRVHLVVLSEPGKYKLIVVMHHIASDGWSLSILVKDLAEIYNAYVHQREPQLPSLPVQYADYALWQNQYMDGEVLDKQLEYWKVKLEGVASLELPTDQSRPPIYTAKGKSISFKWDRLFSRQLNDFCLSRGATLFMTLLATFKVLLYRYTGQRDICVGTTVAGRSQPELENLAGFFVNTLPLRSVVDGNMNFIELLEQVKQTTLEGYEHQDIPFEKIVEAVTSDRDLSRSPLIQVLLVLQNTPAISQLQLANVELITEDHESATAKFDIAVSLGEISDEIFGAVDYYSEIYKEQTIERFITHYERLLKAAMEDPYLKIAELSMHSDKEEHQLLIDFNNNVSDYSYDKSIVDHFQEQVIQSPGNIAISCGDKQLTYRQLNERSSQLAHYLLDKGVIAEMLVPICMDRSIELIIGILAILKAGAAYVPIDPRYPKDWIGHALNDTSASIVIVSRDTRMKLNDFVGLDYIEADDATSIAGRYPVTNPQPGITPGSLAYVIYTSGTTGHPKGVMIEHRSVVSLVKGVDYVSFSEKDVLLSTASPSFDGATFEYWGMLLNGGKLVMCSEHNLLDCKFLKKEIKTNQVNIMWFTAGLFYRHVQHDIHLFDGIKTILVGGEQLSRQHIERFINHYPSVKIINGYGPTENTTFSLTYHIQEISANRTIPIGRPVSSRKVYILNSYQSLCGVLTPGEIYVAGSGLARGYLNMPEATNEKFIANPFGTGKLYRTGDIGRWLPDGNVEFMGRTDEQVKVRGYRIEPAEIEYVVNESKLVNQVIVVLKDGTTGDKRLVGYVVPGEAFNEEALLLFLRSRLPEYMVPLIWVKQEELPLTNNGKIDRNALPDLDAGFLPAKYSPAKTQVEEQLVEVWQKLFHIENIGIDDNFFELGGDSLETIALVNEMRQMNFNVSPKDIFAFQTIRGLSKFIEEHALKSFDREKAIVPIQKNGNNPPFFAIPGFLLYRQLSCHLGAAQPFYSFEPTDLYEKNISTKDIAKQFIDEMKDVQQSGPYFMGAFCGHVNVLLEMAHQLLERGDNVGLIVLFESYGPKAIRSKHSAKYIYDKLKSYNKTLADKSISEKIKFFPKEFYKVLKAIHAVLFKQKKEANDPYKFYPGKVVLIKSSIVSPLFSDAPQMGWSGYFNKAPVITVSGDHMDIVRGAGVEELARRLSEVLEDARKKM